jgi:hypothetical protein
MIPTISQQLKAIKVRIEESIIPELPLESKFAREQASFIVTTLDWLLDTHKHAYRYEVVENVEYRNLIAAMLRRNIAADAEVPLVAAAKEVIQEKGPLPDEASIPLDDVLEQNRRLKQAAMALYAALSARFGSTDNPMRDLLAAVSMSQAKREVAFFSKTGWVQPGDDLGVLLAEVENRQA